MKVKNTNVLTALLLLFIGGISLGGQPMTTELREPEAIEITTPEVPVEFARHRITGEVAVTFRIDENGRTQDIEVVDASHRLYGESVKNALRTWRFERPETAGVLYLLPVRFN